MFVLLDVFQVAQQMRQAGLPLGTHNRVVGRLEVGHQHARKLLTEKAGHHRPPPLAVDREKTKVVKLNQPAAGLSFLGFTLRYDRDLLDRGHRYLNTFPSQKAMAHAQDQLRKLTGPRQSCLPIPELIGEINRWSRGWRQYFAHGYPKMTFRQLDWFLLRRLGHHLARRSQRPFRPPEGVSLYAHLQTLGLQFLQPTTR